MNLPSRTRAGLVVALLIGAPDAASAQAPSPAPAPASPQAPAPTGGQAPPAGQAPSDPVVQEPTRQGRTGRTSRRQPSTTQRGGGEARPSREAGPTRQELSFTANLLGGYDDNLTAGLGTGAGITPTAMTSGSTASLDGTLSYFRGNQLRSFSLGTTGNLMAYPDYFDAPVAGGTATVEGRTAIGRANTIVFSERGGYEPLINVLSQGGNGVVLPPELGAPSPTTGLYDRQSLSSNTRVSLETRWGRRDTTTVDYAYSLRNFLDDTTEASGPLNGDNRGHAVTTTYSRTLGTGVKARANYRYQDLETDDTFFAGSAGTVETTRPTTTHRIEGGADVEHALDRRGRTLTWTVTAGAGRIETISSASRLPYSAWMPVGSAVMKLAFTSTWSLDADYRRDFTLLQGVTDDVYATDSITVSTGGLVTRRTQLRVGATYGNWKTPVASGVTDTFNVYGGLFQVRQFVTDTLAFTASYNYYHHVYSNPAALPEGFPSDYDRNAFRVGITLWVPLIGAPSATQGSSTRQGPR